MASSVTLLLRGRVRIVVTNVASVMASCSFSSSANVRKYDPSSFWALLRQ